MSMQYDYLVVGAGLFGCVFAYEATQRGKKCLLIDKRDHLGGNVYCENIEGINVHKYGPHIFHTNDERIWNYVNQFTTFNHFVLSPIANYKGKLFNLPFNMNTFYQMWGLTTPDEVQDKIQSQVAKLNIDKPKNLEEQALSMVGSDIYHALIKGYTEKQWGCKATELPAFIIKRLPLRFTFNNNYFNDKYQGIPIGGYNTIIHGLTKNIDHRLNVDYFRDKNSLDNLAAKVVYTGKIDEYFNYQYGVLNYRSLKFETEILDTPNYQGVALMNFTDSETPYTRIAEHKHFEFGKQPKTVITKEYPDTWSKEKEAYYPINNERNNAIYKKYKAMSKTISDKVIFGGRLAEYRYYDMHQIIGSALHKVSKEFAD